MYLFHGGQNKTYNDMNYDDGDGMTPLYIASQNGFPDVDKLMLDAGADVPLPGRGADGV